MSLLNPALNAPRLASSQPRRPASRSPSRSPARKRDPLLRDLSPSKTLSAFSKQPGDARNDALAKSIENASPSQRLLGGKVAQACSDLRAWTRELESWEWPGTFDLPEPARKRLRLLDTRGPLARRASDAVKEEEYLGSLPISTVDAREHRVEEICVEFDGIDFEELKSFVLSAHSRAGIRKASVDDSIGTIGAATDLKRLDDFTALVTASILQALPYLPRLTRLLDTWTTRLTILRATTRYLRDLKKARTDLDKSWASLDVSPKQRAAAPLTSESLEEMKTAISTQVYSLGKRLDRFLDMLEGRPEVVPDSWIDDFEDLEQDYGEWVVKAERKALESEWKTMKEQVRETVLGLAKEDEKTRETPDTRMGQGPVDVRDLQGSPLRGARPNTTTIVSPTVTTQTVVDDEGHYTSSQSVSGGTGTTPFSTSIITTTIAGPISEPSSKPKEKSPSRRRHMPITVDYDRPDETFDITDGNLPKLDSDSQPAWSDQQRSATPDTAVQAAPAPNNVRQRAAFLNGDIEKSESLIKGKSAPIVRPFEHASNAFTRLFKKEGNDNDEPRNNQAPTSTDAGKVSTQIERSTTISANGSGGGRSSTPSSSKSNRLEYADLARAPAHSNAQEKSRGRDRSERRDVGSKMAYGDLVMALPPRDHKPRKKSEDSRRAALGTRDSAESGSTRSDDSKRAKSVVTTITSIAETPIAMDLVGPSVNQRSAEMKPTSQPTTPRAGLPRNESAPEVPTMGMRSFGESNISALVPTRSREEGDEPTNFPLRTIQPTLPQPQTYIPAVRSPQSMKQMNVPETYRPTGLAAPVPLPAVQDQFPSDWPLPATPNDTGTPQVEYTVDQSEWAPSWAQNISTADPAIESEAFEEVFVDPLPSSSASLRPHTASSKIAERDFGSEGPTARPQSAPGLRSKEPRVIPERSSSKGAVPARSLGADLPASSIPRPVSIIKEENLSPVPAAPGPDDNAAAYFGNQGVKKTKIPSAIAPQPRMVQIPEASTLPDIDSSPQPVSPDEAIIRRASAASIDLYSRDDLRSIEIPRRSVDLPVSGPETPKDRLSTEFRTESPMKLNDSVEFPSPPPSAPGRRSSARSSASSAQSVLASRLSDMSQNSAPLNAAMMKQRGTKARSRSSLGEDNGANIPTKPSSPLQPGEDHFDRHVSEVLDRVHAPIRFKTRAGAETPVYRGTVESRMKVKAERQGKNMTLAPAELTPKKTTAADPEVKLYHLTQVGRAEPIKLYVRLVGEETQRVMVRVGGGWADLADYLRQYAEHHGSRTVSEGALELQTADAVGTSGAGSYGKRNFSGPASAVEPKSRSPVAPSTSKFYSPTTSTTSTTTTTTTTTDKASGGLQMQTTFDFGRPAPSSKPRLWLGDDSDNDDDQQQQRIAASPSSSTPRSARTISRPSTANAALRPDSRSGGAPFYSPSSPVSPGLGGTSRAELPQQKAKWVEGMIEKAMKSASAAGSPVTGAGGGSAEKAQREERERYFGEMGKAGTTRRVMFRPASGAEVRR